MAQLHRGSRGLSFGWLEDEYMASQIYLENKNQEQQEACFFYFKGFVCASLNLRHFLLMWLDIYIYTWLHATVHWRDNATETPQSDGLTV